MSILVTGGAGYIGSHTVVELLNADREVVIVDDFSNSKPEVLDAIRQITGKDFKFYELNYLDRKKLDKVFKENNIEAVMNFAGFKAVGESGQKPIEYYTNNISGTLTLLDVMPNRPLSAFDTNFQNMNVLSDYYVQNASFLRCDNITLGYSFNKLFGVLGGRIYGTVQNPFVITKYKGLDPEVANAADKTFGIDKNVYPRPLVGIRGVRHNF